MVWLMVVLGFVFGWLGRHAVLSDTSGTMLFVAAVLCLSAALAVALSDAPRRFVFGG